VNHIISLIVLDTRQADASNLTEKEKKNIREQFDDIDVDHSGTIEFTEVVNYYTRLREEKLAALRQIADTSIKNNPNQKGYYEQEYEKRAGIAKRCFEKNVSFFMSKDVDNNHVVTWEEFLNYEAKAITSQIE
jgi:hypothetical protein